MTTPPLDLPSLKELAASQGNHWGLSVSLSASDLLALLDRLETAEKAVAAVREIHKPKKSWNGRDYCVSCFTDQGYDGAFGVLYPCPTITALDGVPNA